MPVVCRNEEETLGEALDCYSLHLQDLVLHEVLSMEAVAPPLPVDIQFSVAGRMSTLSLYRACPLFDIG